MCGIGGIISFSPISGKRLQVARSISENLLIALQDRGTDATGIATINLKGENVIFKKDVDAEKFIGKNNKDIDSCFALDNMQVILLHTRQATHGKKSDSANNHPHYSKETGNILIHNGVVSGVTKEELEGYKIALDGECDSEIILKLSDKIGFASAIKNLWGTKAVAFWNRKLKHLLLYKDDTQPLVIAKLLNQNLYVFASTESILAEGLSVTECVDEQLELYTAKKVFKHVFRELEDEELITFNLNKGKIVLGKISSKKYYYNTYDAYDASKKAEVLDESGLDKLEKVEEELYKYQSECKEKWVGWD